MYKKVIEEKAGQGKNPETSSKEKDREVRRESECYSVPESNKENIQQNRIEHYELLIMACIISVEILTNRMIDLLLLDLFSLMRKLT